MSALAELMYHLCSGVCLGITELLAALRKLPWSFSARQQRFTPRLAAALDRIDVFCEQLGRQGQPNPGRRNEGADMSPASPVRALRISVTPIAPPPPAAIADERELASAFRELDALEKRSRQRGIPVCLPACRLILMRLERAKARQRP